MFRNQFKLAWRHLAKNSQFTFLNLLGLSIGLACGILIFLWVDDELHVNKFNKNDERIYQVMQQSANGDGAIQNTPGLLADALKKEMPEVEYAAAAIPATWYSNKGLFSFNDKHIRADAQFVSEDYFNIFSCHFIEGNAVQLFADKNNFLISRDLAMKLFGTTNCIGNVIEWNQENFNESFSVAGVFEKFPSSSTIQFDAAFNYNKFLEYNPKLLKWTNNDPSTYLLLKRDADFARFNQKIANLVKTKDAKSGALLFAQRFSDTYLHNHYSNGAPSGGRIEYVRLFSIIAIFILAIACINFMNLSTAKALKRIKEVGVQKVIGATRRSIIVQYMTGSILMAFLSLIIAIVLISALLPAFKQVTGKDLRLQFNAAFILPAVLITLMTGIVAGSYPALYLSRFRPAFILKGMLKNSVSEVMIRKGLVVFQFTVSVVLIVSVLVIYQQMRLIQTKNLGYNRDHVLYFDKGGKLSENKEDYRPGAVYRDLETLIQQIKAVPGVINASNFRHSIVNRQGGTTDVKWPGKSPEDQTAFTDIAGGYGLIETLGIGMKEGRSYSKDFGSDNDKVVLNEAAVQAIGLTDPVGKSISIWGNEKQIIGVTNDFHFQSFYENIKPCFFDLSMNQRVAKIMVRIKAGNEKVTIDKLSSLYKSYTGETLDYKFLDEDYQYLYASEERIATLSNYFAAMAILISCLGLFGLAAFTAQKRQKEIGIRKVIGASAENIIAMLSKDFLVLVLLSLLVATPFAWWLTNHWLESFAYRIEIKPMVFVVTCLFVTGITLLTISFQSIRAAVRNPVKSLRME